MQIAGKFLVGAKKVEPVQYNEDRDPSAALRTSFSGDYAPSIPD
jgi:hypothetical protein